MADETPRSVPRLDFRKRLISPPVKDAMEAASADIALYANNLCFALYNSGQYGSAVWWLQKAIRLDSRRAVAYMNLGDAYVALKRRE